MNLRHIDPRSTDWMDAMLEGEPQNRGKRGAEVGGEQAGEGLVSSAVAAGSEPGVSLKAPAPDGPG